MASLEIFNEPRPDMTEQNMTVDHLESNNIIKKKKVDKGGKYNNNDIDLNLENGSEYMQPNINIIIDKESNRTIRLELRNPDNECVVKKYKINEINGDAVRTGLIMDSIGFSRQNWAPDQELSN
ncbi:unnamed protein product [Leptidea sinapis]|uniref:Uncharacterized protein n=1 Tax=Leptidea sinapis TaxID=189913 RepID=A0A5E4QKX7_9NEOP|nr:unnamed protein product [Leptidea sinapis]